MGGNTGKLFDEPGKNQVSIPPFQVLIIKTRERINLPRFLIARWNIRVRWAYQGLLWVGGPQVDPGWAGHLLCPLYNLSDKEVTLKFGEAIALMDFVTTTPFKEGESIKYPRPPSRTLFEDYNTELKSALYTEARKRIDEVDSKVNNFETRLNTSITIVLTVIAILVATLSLLVGSYQKISYCFPSWPL
ncbi:MAG: hypothetical protein E6J89_15840 [Deltaproteobacteria bacterium]|nr:MAG: hypothetical protein E6J89_15840 [Deltaproteobacteria bacterium]